MSLSEPRTRHLLFLQEVVVSSRSEELRLAKSINIFEEKLSFLEDKCNGWYMWQMEMEFENRDAQKGDKRYIQVTWSRSLSATYSTTYSATYCQEKTSRGHVCSGNNLMQTAKVWASSSSSSSSSSSCIKFAWRDSSSSAAPSVPGE